MSEDKRELPNEFLFRPESVLEGPFWPERIKVITCRRIGTGIEIQGIGLKSERFFSRILKKGDLEKVRSIDLEGKDFSGDAEAFFLSMEGRRIRFAFQFDPLFAVNVSQIDPLPHQIDAVYHYILKQPRIRFLLADDPGAGKTIMAGLMLKELKQRGLVEKVLIVIPGHLRDQWVRELKEKFSETFRTVDRAVINASWGRNVWQEENQAITSMDLAKQEDIMVSLAEARWDLVIVDEAHKMAAYKYGEKTEKTERYKLGELLSRNSDFLLFLTATPHRGDPSNFRLFLDLLEPGFFATDKMLAESIRNKDNPLFLRRLKEDMRSFDNTPLFPPRKVITVKYRLSDDEKRLYNAVTEYIEKHYNKAMQKEKRNVAFALLILQRRLASSVRAIRKSLERRRDRLQELLEKGEIIQESGYIDEEALEDSPELERWRKEDELLEKLTSAETLEELKVEIARLTELIALAKDAEKKEVETKLNELRKVMEEEHIRKKGEKLLIFSESKDTLEYLVEKLRGWGYPVTCIHGAMNLNKRIEAEHEFKEKAQIMVSTEAGGEGINLQFCWLMVNYDIPWNPNRLEQRMGRIHRYGQQYEVHIYNMVAIDTMEGRILDTLFSKLDIIGKQLGPSRVFDVIGDILPGTSLQDLIIDAVTNKRSLDDILQDIERIPDEEALKRAKEASLEGLATKHIDLTRILGEERTARENRLVPEYIEKFFLRASQKLAVNTEKRNGFYKIANVPYELRKLPFEFKLRFGEIFREYSKFSFEKEKAFKEQADFVAPGHPLLEAFVEKILERYGDEADKGAVFLDPSGSMNGFIWFLEGRVNDGTASIAGKRIFALYQDSQNSITQISPSVLWDLKPHDKSMAPEFLKSAPAESSILAFAVETVLPEYLGELKKQREHDAGIKSKYGIRSLQELILQSEGKLLDYETRKGKGENIPEVTLQNERRNREELDRKKEQLEKQIESEVHLLLSPPKVLGVVSVVPKLPADDTLKADKEIEELGMRVVIDYEVCQGRSPENVATQNLGFDIRSKAPDGSVRYIEAKARARDGKIALTPNEWLMAHRLGSEYWLYVVIASDGPKEKLKPYTIQNPAKNLEAVEEIDVVRYIITRWKEVLTAPDQISMVPELPFTNIMTVAGLMKRFEGIVSVLDKHFDEKGLKFLKEIDPTKVKELRILMGKSHLRREFKELYKAFEKEMMKARVRVQCRVVADADDSETHDRYIISQNLVYDIPPLNVINEKLGHITRITSEKDVADLRKRFEKYWLNATNVEKISTKDRD
jgi:superfamily II DNA or RNA helicase